jgi:SNF2 family DNA or RNA helicase
MNRLGTYSVKGNRNSLWPLEKFEWKRLVIDEIHELAHLPETEGQGWAVRHLIACSRWGLTGTPMVQNTIDVHKLGTILGVHVGWSDVQLCRRFVDHFLRSSSCSANQHLVAQERIISFHLSTEERALYNSRRFELLEQLQRNASSAHRELLLMCSHFALRTTGSGKSTAGSANNAIDEVERVLSGRKSRLNDLTDRCAKHKSRLDVLANIISDVEHHNSARRESAMGQKEELIDKLRKDRLEMTQIERYLAFFKNTLQELESRSALGDCPICLHTMRWGSTAITPCGHLQCTQCLKDVLVKLGHCPTCREVLAEDQWRILERSDDSDSRFEDHAEHSDFSTLTDVELKSNEGFGSKIAHILGYIKQIRTKDSTAKILIYSQWDALKVKLSAALGDRLTAGSVIDLGGNPKQIAAAIEKFSGAHSSSFVLLCSLEHKAAGLNLQCANHVMLVHPFFSEHTDHPMSWEAQAIGRVLRPGQKRPVTIWRFLANQTIEQEIRVRQNRMAGPI